MAEVIPFKGILYNPEAVHAGSVMAPPYDIVSPELKEELYNKSPHNIIRVDFGKDDDGDNEHRNRYTRASQFLSDWLKEEVLLHDPDPYYYCYEISYELCGEHKKIRGVLGAVRIEELGTGKVHPHEMTYSKPKSDRLNILRHCKANTSPIFSLYSGKKRLTSTILDSTSNETPYIEARDRDGFTHRLWKISSKDSVDTIREELSDKDVYIADGHHRYETALTFRKEMEEKGMGSTGKEPFNYVLMFLSNMEEEGLTLLPTHRIIEINSDIKIKDSIRKYFDIQKVSMEGTEKQLRNRMLEIMRSNIHTFGMHLTNSGNYYTLTYKNSDLDLKLPESLKKLDVSILHRFIFEKLLNVDHFEYEMGPDIAVERARKGSFEAVFFLNPTRIQDVKEVALAGHRMPPKSTYFYPKLLTGMVIYKF